MVDVSWHISTKWMVPLEQPMKREVKRESQLRHEIGLGKETEKRTDPECVSMIFTVQSMEPLSIKRGVKGSPKEPEKNWEEDVDEKEMCVIESVWRAKKRYGLNESAEDWNEVDDEGEKKCDTEKEDEVGNKYEEVINEFDDNPKKTSAWIKHI